MIDRAGNFVFATTGSLTYGGDWQDIWYVHEGSTYGIRFPRRAGEFERMYAEWLRGGRRG